jgi:predicted transcriptional regulator
MITQAAVSQYTSKKRGSRLNFQEGAKEEIKKKLADDLVHGSVDDLVVRICRICMDVRAEGAVCKLELCNAAEK